MIAGRALECCPQCAGRGFLAAIGEKFPEIVPCPECAGGMLPGVAPASVDDDLLVVMQQVRRIASEGQEGLTSALEVPEGMQMGLERFAITSGLAAAGGS